MHFARNGMLKHPIPYIGMDANAAAGCPRPSIAPNVFRSQAMDPDASPGLRCVRCAALYRAQSRAEHQLDQAPDARVARARAADVRVPAARARARPGFAVCIPQWMHDREYARALRS